MSTTGYKWEGDPRLVLNEDGVTIEFRGGQPVMDTGLENAVLISLFTDEGWVGNLYADEKSRQIGSRFEKVASGNITVTMLADTENEAKRALKWMVDEGLVGKIEAKAYSRGIGVRVEIKLYSRSGGVSTLLLTRYGGNWINQILDPAHERSASA